MILEELKIQGHFNCRSDHENMTRTKCNTLVLVWLKQKCWSDRLVCASLRFVSDWVYSGVFRDVYGEFMIQVNEEYLSFRGEMPMTHKASHKHFSHQALKMKRLPDRLSSKGKKQISLQLLLPSWICPCVYKTCHEVIRWWSVGSGICCPTCEDQSHLTQWVTERNINKWYSFVLFYWHTALGKTNKQKL